MNRLAQLLSLGIIAASMVVIGLLGVQRDRWPMFWNTLLASGVGLVLLVILAVALTLFIGEQP